MVEIRDNNIFLFTQNCLACRASTVNGLNLGHAGHVTESIWTTVQRGRLKK